MLPYVEKLWTRHFPDYVYEYKFLDQTIANFYKQENQLSQLYKIFAGIAIFHFLSWFVWTCFIHGSAAHKRSWHSQSAWRFRKKYCLSCFKRIHCYLSSLHLLISAPIAYYIMHQWLQNYTYRIPLGAVNIFISD